MMLLVDLWVRGLVEGVLDVIGLLLVDGGGLGCCWLVWGGCWWEMLLAVLLD